MSCAYDKIKNPITKRCILIGGDIFKTLIKDPSIVFSDADLKKIKDAGYTLSKSKTPVLEGKKPTAKLVPKTDLGMMSPITKETKAKDITRIDIVPERIKNKVEKFLEHKNGINEIPYLDEGHKQFCKTGNPNNIVVPLLKSEIKYTIPYSICHVREPYAFKKYIGINKLPYTHGFQKEIELQYNNYNKEIALQLFKDAQFEIDYEWFKDVNHYITNLSTYDAFTVLGYSYQSHVFINKYLIGQMTEKWMEQKVNEFDHDKIYFPFYVQCYTLIDQITLKFDPKFSYKNSMKNVSDWLEECKTLGIQDAYSLFMKIAFCFKFEFWIQVMEIFKSDFKRIINNAPPVRKETVVYRGVTNDYFLKGAKDNYYQNTCFVSSSFNPNHALLYLRDEQCCLKRITLLPGSRVLFISGLSSYPNELEIVINVDSLLYITQKSTNHIYPRRNSSTVSDLCFKTKNKVDIAEIVVVDKPQKSPVPSPKPRSPSPKPAPPSPKADLPIEKRIQILVEKQMSAMKNYDRPLVEEIAAELVELRKKYNEENAHLNKKSSPSPKPRSPELPIDKQIEILVKKQMSAMRARNVPLIKELAAEMTELRKKMPKSPKRKSPALTPDHLQTCIDPTTGSLPTVPTVDGDEDMASLIKDPRQLITIDGLCYDIKSLYDMIQFDIPQGNVFGINPYVKREGLILPFDKTVKPLVLAEGIKRKILHAKSKWIDHTPANADDKEMRGKCKIEEKKTPSEWLKKGWASDKSAFPTKKYYAITFEFPNRRAYLKQNPGRTAIFPSTKEAKQFIDKKLIPVYNAGALWSKKMSVSDGIEVINQNIHMVFEDNQPNRWYAGKMQNLEEEILKYAPAFT